MNIYVYIIISLYFLFCIFFIYKFYKNNFNIKLTLKNLFKCCIKDKEKLKEVLGEERAKKIENELKNCDTPIGFPFDICFNEDLKKEEIILREKIFNILQKRKLKEPDAGKDKLIIPLEATLFLTKGLNPLVNENGEIQIISKHKKISERIEEIIILLKNKTHTDEEILYKDETALLEAINTLLSEMKSDTLLSPDDFEKEEIIIKAKNALIKSKEENHKLEEAVVYSDQVYFPPEDLISKPLIEEHSAFAEPTKPFIMNNTTFISDEESLLVKDDKKTARFSSNISPFDNEDDDKFGDYDETSSSTFGGSMKDLFDDALADIELESEPMKDIPSFYKNIEYRLQKDLPDLDLDNLAHSLKHTLSKDSILSSIFRNLAKTQPIIFSDNKEFLFIDQQCILFAIAKTYGIEFKKYIEIFRSFKGKQLTELSDALSVIFEEFISDIATNNKKVNRAILEDRKGNKFYSYGLFLQTRSFNKGLNTEQFDFFRSFPYNTDYKLIFNSGLDTKNIPKLINDILDSEIKI